MAARSASRPRSDRAPPCRRSRASRRCCRPIICGRSIGCGISTPAGGQFKDITLFTTALEARYGKAADLKDYTRKAQALAYEGERAMFEGYARNKYAATGVIHWMLNNAWPSLIWHLYDYSLRPGGGYFGTKIACEPIHVQYSYDDKSIVVVNDTPADVKGLKVTATLLDLGLAEKFTREAPVDVGPDAVSRVFEIPAIRGI